MRVPNGVEPTGGNQQAVTNERLPYMYVFALCLLDDPGTLLRGPPWLCRASPCRRVPGEVNQKKENGEQAKKKEVTAEGTGRMVPRCSSLDGAVVLG